MNRMQIQKLGLVIFLKRKKPILPRKQTIGVNSPPEILELHNFATVN